MTMYYLIGPQLEEIILAVKEITDPFILGVHLGIKLHELKKIDENYPRDVDRVLNYWLCDSSDCSLEALAIAAVENMGGHGKSAHSRAGIVLVSFVTAIHIFASIFNYLSVTNILSRKKAM